jgi:hypothetical protein
MPPRSARRPSAPAPATPKAAPTWLRPAILALTAILILGYFAIPATDSDTWWQLKTGQYIVEHHALTKPDPFAYTTYLKPPLSHGEALARDFNLTHSWLGQVVFYLVYSAGGFPALILLRAILLTGFCAVVGLIVFHRTAGIYRAIGAAIATAGVAMFSTADRPYLFTYLLLAVTMAILEYRRRLWLLVPLFVLWANLHPGFFLGWAMLGCYCAESLYKRWRGKPQPDDRRLWLVSAAAMLASGLNPNGFRFLEVLVAYRNSPMQSQLYEWQHPRFWEPSWYSFVIWIALVTLIVARSKVRLADFVLFALFAAASLQAVRNVTLMALIGPAIIFSYAGWNFAPRRSAEFAAIALIAAALAGEIGWRHAFQLHAEMWQYPAGAADFLLSHHITGRVFNTYEQGGYWLWRLWPQNQVFIDGRALNETVYSDFMQIAFNPVAADESLIRHYGIDIIAMNSFQLNSGNPYLLPVSLADPSQKEWKLIYRDAQGVIFMRHPPAEVPILDSAEIFKSMDDECSAVLDHTPWKPWCAKSLADVYSVAGRPSDSARWMAAYRQYASQ